MVDTANLERSWAAGFFDGEGTTNSHRRSLQVSIHQVNRENLLRFKAATGNTGTISFGDHVSGFAAYGEKA